MTDLSKIQPSHLQRAAFVYLRQSTPSQVEQNRESTARQYALVERACQLGWSQQQVMVIDEDLGLSGSTTNKRSGFARLTSEVALAHVGIVLVLEVSRLARNNADWHRLLELCGVTDTLLGDSDGVYHPALFNDRLLLGVNCGAHCRWASFGEKATARSCFFPTRPSPAPSARSSSPSPSSGRLDGSGSGSAPNGCLSRCKRDPVARCAGSPRLTPPSTTS